MEFSRVSREVLDTSLWFLAPLNRFDAYLMFPFLSLLLFFIFNTLCFMCAFYAKKSIPSSASSWWLVVPCINWRTTVHLFYVLCFMFYSNNKSIQKSIFVILMQIVCKFPLKTVQFFPSVFFHFSFYVSMFLPVKLRKRKQKPLKKKENRNVCVYLCMYMSNKEDLVSSKESDHWRHSFGHWKEKRTILY